jgi:hypothetical protein
MPLFNMQPKDKKSPRKAEVRPSNVVIRVLPLLLCFVLSVILWCYIVGSGKPAEDPDVSTGGCGGTTEAAPPADTANEPSDTAGSPANGAAETEAHPSDV